MSDETVVKLDSEQANSLWRGAKVELEFLPGLIDSIALVARGMIERDRSTIRPASTSTSRATGFSPL